MSVNYLTDEIKTLIGLEVGPVEATHPVEPSEVRRFHQATMDSAIRYRDGAWASRSRYGARVAPPAFPTFAFRRAAGEDLAVDGRSGDPEFDGIDHELFHGLPPLNVPLRRILNGGYEYSFYRHVRFGERICRTSRYDDIYQRDGKSGPMIFVAMRIRYDTSNGEPLLEMKSTIILR